MIEQHLDAVAGSQQGVVLPTCISESNRARLFRGLAICSLTKTKKCRELEVTQQPILAGASWEKEAAGEGALNTVTAKPEQLQRDTQSPVHWAQCIRHAQNNVRLHVQLLAAYAWASDGPMHMLPAHA